MRGNEDSGPSQMDASEKEHDFFGEIRVQIARGLIGQEDEGVLDKCPGDGDTLLFAARQLEGVCISLSRQADGTQRLVCPFADEGPPFACHLQGQGDVLVDGPCGDELEVLENEPDLSSQQGKPASAYPAQIDTVDQYLSARGTFGAEDQAEKGGLAGTAWPGDENERPLLDVQVKILKRQFAAETLMKMKQLYHLRESVRPEGPLESESREIMVVQGAVVVDPGLGEKRLGVKHIRYGRHLRLISFFVHP